MAIIVGDMHGNVEKVRAFLSYKPVKEHIALGDFIDGPGGQEQDVEVLHLLLESNAILLWGNHELCYLLRNPFLLAGYDKVDWPENSMADPRTKIIEENKDRFQAAYAVDGWLCTHAGAASFIVKNCADVARLADNINMQTTEVLFRNNRRIAVQSGLFQISPGTMGIPGGVFMLRAGEERGPSDRFKQIFGHSKHREPWHCKGSFRDKEFIALATGQDSCWIFDTEKDELVNLWQS